MTSMEMALLLIATCMIMVFAALQGQPHLKRNARNIDGDVDDELAPQKRESAGPV